MENNNQEKKDNAMNANIGPHGYESHIDNNLKNIQSINYAKYTLKSNPERSIMVPPEYDEKAGKLVKFTLGSETPEDLLKKINYYPSLTGMYITDKVLDLMHLKKRGFKSLKMQDEVYFLTCWYMSNDELSKNNVIHDGFPIQESGAERVEKIRNNQLFRSILDGL